MAVIRSSSAVVVSSQNANREWVYSQQQTFSAEGYSGQAFNPHFPHTTSSVGTTKNCTDCHLSKNNDNNAWMTQLLGFGTGTVNFFGRYAYVGEGREGFHAVVWTEPDEPQAAIGSHLHKIAYPANYKKHRRARRESAGSATNITAHDIQDIVLRGEYLYTANGPGGFEVFDVANIDQKGFSERIVSAPVSPLGQRTRVHTKYRDVASRCRARSRSIRRGSAAAGKRRAADRSVLRLCLRLRSRGRTGRRQRRAHWSMEIRTTIS